MFNLPTTFESAGSVSGTGDSLRSEKYMVIGYLLFCSEFMDLHFKETTPVTAIQQKTDFTAPKG